MVADVNKVQTSTFKDSKVQGFVNLLDSFYLFHWLNWLAYTEPIVRIKPIKPIKQRIAGGHPKPETYGDYEPFKG